MQLLSDTGLREAIRRAVSVGDISCAVAFWGRGAENLIGSCKGRNVRLICNLRMGGTDPDVVARLIAAGAKVLQCNRLHAKVYIGATTSVVTSANASINGLGIEGEELAGWIETGVEVSSKMARPWFDELWPRCMPITDADLEAARRLFRERKVIKPSVDTFAKFYPTDDDFPLVSWGMNLDSDYNEETLKESFGHVNDTIRSWIDDAINESSEDFPFLKRGVWVLRWMIRRDGRPARRYAPRWICSSGKRIERAILLNGGFCDAVLAIDPTPPQPFDPTDQRFQRAFYDVLSSADFKDLRETEYEGSFFAPRMEITWAFWQALRRHYDALDCSA